VDGTAAGTTENPAPIGTTITCYVCHNEATSILDSVTFTSGHKIGGLIADAGCIACHQGLGSTETVTAAIARAGLTDDDTPSPDLAFVDSHTPAAATTFGTEAQGAYEYAGHTYQGRFLRGGDRFTCVRCHDPHTLQVQVETCNECHTFSSGDVHDIRVNTTDFAGDGNVDEGISFQIEHLQADLYAAIQAYAKNVAGVALVFDPDAYPYFGIDSNGNGQPDPGEIKPQNKFNAWTPRLLRAAYNYYYFTRDPGAFAHNSTYTIQVLYDSLADLGADVSGMTRP
jgi:hypothetical protein